MPPLSFPPFLFLDLLHRFGIDISEGTEFHRAEKPNSTVGKELAWRVVDPDLMTGTQGVSRSLPGVSPEHHRL